MVAKVQKLNLLKLKIYTGVMFLLFCRDTHLASNLNEGDNKPIYKPIQ